MKKAFALRLNHILRPSLLCLFSVLSLVLLRPRIASAASIHSAQCSGWQIVSSPNTTSSFNVLNAVAAISSKNAWAVGYARNIYNGPYRTLIERWDGSDWDLISSQNPGTVNVLNSVAAVSASSAKNIWAVGTYQTSSSFTKTLIEHWNGREWDIVPGVNPGPWGNILKSVVVLSPTNVWAAGEYINVMSSTGPTLVEHWDGTIWSVVPSPTVTFESNQLNGIVAFSKNDIQAIGDDFDSGGSASLVEHWDGTAWTTIPGVNAPSFFNLLNGAARVPRTHKVWAVGFLTDGNGVNATTLTEISC